MALKLYARGKFSHKYVGKDGTRLTTRKRDALAFASQAELDAWLDQLGRRKWFELLPTIPETNEERSDET